MKSPYIKKIKRIGKIKVYLVDGFYIRNKIDKEFTNFGQHYRFKFIPENEFWIDKANGYGNEKKYYIDHLLVEHRLMARGSSYDEALKKADLIEKKERRISEDYNSIKNIKKEENIYRIIRKARIKEQKCKIDLWVVKGMLVRNLFFIDFTEGGHDFVYDFVPKNEVWIDDDLEKDERNFVLLHELYERRLMAKGKNYDKAHNKASKLEYYYRENPHRINKRLKKEIRKQKRIF